MGDEAGEEGTQAELELVVAGEAGEQRSELDMVREPVRRQRGEEGAQAADELVIAVVVRAGAWRLERDEPEDVGVQRRDGTDNGLVGEAGRPQHVVDGFTEAQPMRPETAAAAAPAARRTDG